jgi:hypothetical protein
MAGFMGLSERLSNTVFDLTLLLPSGLHPSSLMRGCQGVVFIWSDKLGRQVYPTSYINLEVQAGWCISAN